jgi:hypothetical protein
MKSLIITFFCSITFLFAFSQEVKPIKNRPFAPIKLWLGNPTKEVPSFIRAKAQVVFDIENVNTFLYSVKFKELQRDVLNDEEIANKEFNIIYKPEYFRISELSTADFLIPKNLDSKNVSDVIKLEVLLKSKRRNLKQTEKKLENLNELNKLVFEDDTLFTKSENDSVIKDRKRRINTLKTQILIDDLDKDSLFEQIKVVNETYLRNGVVVDSIQEAYDSLMKSIDNDDGYIIQFKGKVDEYLSIISNINKKVDLYNELLFLLFSIEPYGVISERKKNLLKVYLGSEVTPAEILYVCNESFSKLDSKYKEISETLESMKNRGTLELASSRLTKFHNSIDKQKFGELFRQIIKIYNAIEAKNWTVNFQTTNISDKADRISYSLDFTPVSNEYSLTNKSYSYNYDFDIVGGIKIDASAGLFYHFNLNDQQFRLEAVTDSTTSIVEVKNQDQFIPSVGALFNVYFRSPYYIKPALNFGVGTNIEKLNYYLGMGLLFGRSERIGLNIGAVGGTVKRIADEYQGKTIINSSVTDLLNTELMKTDDPFRIGWYIGISYNFTGKNKETMATMLKK